MKFDQQQSRHSATRWFLVACILSLSCKVTEAAFGSTFSTNTTFFVPKPLAISYSAPVDKLVISKYDNTLQVLQHGVNFVISGTDDVPLDIPEGVWVDPAGNIFVANSNHHNIVKVTADGQLSIFAGIGVPNSTGDYGPASLATFNIPKGIFGDKNGNLFVAEHFGHRIRKINKSDGIVTTVVGTGQPRSAGDGGLATLADIIGPIGVFVDIPGNIFFTTFGLEGDCLVRWVAASTGIIQTIAGKGDQMVTFDGVLSANSHFLRPAGIWGDSKGNLYVGDQYGNQLIVIARENNYERVFLIDALPGADTVSGDDASDRLFVSQWSAQMVTVFNYHDNTAPPSDDDDDNNVALLKAEILKLKLKVLTLKTKLKECSNKAVRNNADVLYDSMLEDSAVEASTEAISAAVAPVAAPRGMLRG